MMKLATLTLLYVYIMMMTTRHRMGTAFSGNGRPPGAAVPTYIERAAPQQPNHLPLVCSAAASNSLLRSTKTLALPFLRSVINASARARAPIRHARRAPVHACRWRARNRHLACSACTQHIIWRMHARAPPPRLGGRWAALSPPEADMRCPPPQRCWTGASVPRAVPWMHGCSPALEAAARQANGGGRIHASGHLAPGRPPQGKPHPSTSWSKLASMPVRSGAATGHEIARKHAADNSEAPDAAPGAAGAAPILSA